MNERPTTFNHGRLCEMLRTASDFDLANVLLDVKKEQDRRAKEQCKEYANNIMNAIREAIDAGFMVNFYSDCADEGYPDLSIHSNNLFLTNVNVKVEGEDEEDE